jgi:hypothetical protein
LQGLVRHGLLHGPTLRRDREAAQGARLLSGGRPMTLYEQLLEDLAAEQAALDAVLGGITDTQWDLPIPSVPHLGRRRLRLG